MKLDDATADGVLRNVLTNSTQTAAEIDTLGALAHESNKGTIRGHARGSSDSGTTETRGEEPGPLGRHRSPTGRGRGDGRVATDEEGTADEGPQLSGRVTRDNDPGLFDADIERQSSVEAQRNVDKLLHDQLTAQLKSGGPVKPSKLKPAGNGNLFEADQPTTMGLFGGGERGSLSTGPGDRISASTCSRPHPAGSQGSGRGPGRRPPPWLL